MCASLLYRRLKQLSPTPTTNSIPPAPTTITHTNGVFAWLVNRADCSHLTAFRFKYLSVSWWAKSALTVRLLFKVADRQLDERASARESEEGEKSIQPSPVKWDSFPCVHILSWLRLFFPLTLNSRIRQATSAPERQCISILASPQ